MDYQHFTGRDEQANQRIDHLTFEADTRLKHVEQFDIELENQKNWLRSQEE